MIGAVKDFLLMFFISICLSTIVLILFGTFDESKMGVLLGCIVVSLMYSIDSYFLNKEQ